MSDQFNQLAGLEEAQNRFIDIANIMSEGLERLTVAVNDHTSVMDDLRDVLAANLSRNIPDDAAKEADLVKTVAEMQKQFKEELAILLKDKLEQVAKETITANNAVHRHTFAQEPLKYALNKLIPETFDSPYGLPYTRQGVWKRFREFNVWMNQRWRGSHSDTYLRNWYFISEKLGYNVEANYQVYLQDHSGSRIEFMFYKGLLRRALEILYENFGQGQQPFEVAAYNDNLHVDLTPVGEAVNLTYPASSRTVGRRRSEGNATTKNVSSKVRKAKEQQKRAKYVDEAQTQLHNLEQAPPKPAQQETQFIREQREALVGT